MLGHPASITRLLLLEGAELRSGSHLHAHTSAAAEVFGQHRTRTPFMPINLKVTLTDPGS
jgi:hypothetical protein